MRHFGGANCDYARRKLTRVLNTSNRGCSRMVHTTERKATMRLIPVIDIQAGRAVHAKRGQRDGYAPVDSVLVDGADPLELAEAYVEKLGAGEIYVADLDAITQGGRDIELWRSLVNVAGRLLLDVGIAAADQAELVAAAVDDMRCQLIVGSESLQSSDELNKIARSAPILFSLDLRDGLPIAAWEPWRVMSPLEIVSEVHAAGVRELIVLDLARVGAGEGTGTETLCQAIRRDLPEMTILVGGGVRSVGELDRLRAAACDGALLGSALHSGAIDRASFIDHGR